MVFVATSAACLAEALRRADSADAIWCGSDVISDTEYMQPRRPNLSRFDHSLAELQMDDGTLGTVEEHHPGQTIWVEAPRQA